MSAIRLDGTPTTAGRAARPTDARLSESRKPTRADARHRARMGTASTRKVRRTVGNAGLGSPMTPAQPARRQNATAGQAGPRRCGKARCP